MSEAVEGSETVPKPILHHDSLLERIDKQNKLLATQTEALTSLCHTIKTGLNPRSEHAAFANDGNNVEAPRFHPTENGVSSLEERARTVWQQEILQFILQDSPYDILKDFTFQPEYGLDDMLSGRQPWHGWAYRRSYPKLAHFLAKASIAESSKAQVVCEEGYDDVKESRIAFRDSTLDHDAVWKVIRYRKGKIESRQDLELEDGDDESNMALGTLAIARILQITDLSPLLTVMLLTSTPKYVSFART